MNPRASRRLEIARGLLHLSAKVDVLAHIRALPKPRQEEIRASVDWVEDSEREEQRQNESAAHANRKREACDD